MTAHVAADTGAPVSCLRDLLDPLTPDEFLRDDWHRRFRIVRGRPGRFESLMSWGDLNRILSEHHLDHPRARVVKDGRTILQPPIIRHRQVRDLPASAGVDAEALSGHLRDGATFVLNKAEEVHLPLRNLAESLERTLGTSVSTNMFVSCKALRGLDRHWDDRDVIVLQVHGTKHWKIFGTTRPHPIPSDLFLASERPEAPVWEGVVEPGDMLYLPRGVWHEVTSLDAPTLHLSLDIETCTGEHFLNWLTCRLRSCEAARMDVPRRSDRQAMRAHAARIKAEFDALWHADLLEEFLAWQDQRAEPRAAFGLPLTMLEHPLGDPDTSFAVRWRTARPVIPVQAADGTLRLMAHRRQWEFDAAAGPVIARLSDGGWHAVSDLCTAFASDLAKVELIDFLESLQHDGLLAMCPMSDLSEMI